MINRARRLRGNEIIRNMVRETRISKSSLVYPIFIVEGKNIKEEIETMSGQYRYSIDKAVEEIKKLCELGIKRLLLFGIPAHKDEIGSLSYDEDGIIQRAIKSIKRECRDAYIITDVCMCEYTSHGHCGIIEHEDVNNDVTLKYLGKIALSHAKAGADMIAPSDMMDGRVAFIRAVLDENEFTHIPIMAYSVKYASAFYGPFREAAESAPSFGDRKTYQMDYHNKREALKEAKTDIAEGADIIMVKPAMNYLDIIKSVKEISDIPVAAYSVSGEYSMVKSAAQKGCIDEEKIVCEMAVAAYRAGADIYISYYAKEIAQYIERGLIG